MALQRYWYKKSPLTWLLLPAAWLFCLAAMIRRLLYEAGILSVHKLPVPVVVVGNISVGGSGKTPLVVWIVDFLRESGFQPGIVSRGYKGRASNWPQQVRPDSDPRIVGDEPVLLARRCACPIAAAPDRVAAANALLEHSHCDVIISDDGLQHYALGRDVEIAVIDGTRRLGNKHCLPAGPLREPSWRLNSTDLVVCNGLPRRLEYAMKLRGNVAHRLDGSGETRKLEDFKGRHVHAVAGIAFPERFFEALERFDIQISRHAFPDHHSFSAQDLPDDEADIVMTEKDAVKCTRFADSRYWYVPVMAEIDQRFGPRLLTLLESEKRTGAVAGSATGS